MWWYDGGDNEIDRVSTAHARAMEFHLAREDGQFCGTSTGANVMVALRLAERLGPGSTVVSTMCDTGMKYLKSFSQQTGLSITLAIP
jgi:cysteine synthase A